MEGAVRRRVAELRAELGLSQQQLAGRAGMHQSVLSRIESGVRRISFGDVERLAAALGVDRGDLLRTDEEASPAPSGLAPVSPRGECEVDATAAPDEAFLPRVAQRVAWQTDRAAKQLGEPPVPSPPAAAAASPPARAALGFGESRPAGRVVTAAAAAPSGSFMAPASRRPTDALPTDQLHPEPDSEGAWEGHSLLRAEEGELESAEFSATARRIAAATFTAARLVGTEVAGPAPSALFATGHAAARPGQLARLWRRELGMGAEAPVPDLPTLLELRAALNVALLSAPGGPAGLLLTERGAPFLFVNAALPASDRRLALAHLLGHHALGHVHAACRSLDARRGERTELAATWFALEFLAPAAGVAAWLDARAARPAPQAPDLAAVGALAAQYGISPHVALERCRASGRLPARAAPTLQAAVDARAGELAARAAFAGELTDSLSEPLTLPHAEVGVRVVRVPRRLREHALEALAAGRLDIPGAAALLWLTPGRLAAWLRDVGLREQ
jgi:transcriptional regulator with XRE-family HTH domain/Zn-dependent peptidase ImmA (M78 family)